MNYDATIPMGYGYAHEERVARVVRHHLGDAEEHHRIPIMPRPARSARAVRPGSCRAQVLELLVREPSLSTREVECYFRISHPWALELVRQARGLRERARKSVRARKAKRA